MDISENEWFITTPLGQIAVMSWGEPSKEKILVCHGRNDSIATFRPLIKLLPQSYYYVGFDLPGCGKSDSFPKGLPLNFYCLVPQIQAVVEHLAWKSFIFLAHSMGSQVGHFYNVAYPGKITKVINIDPLPYYNRFGYVNFEGWYDSTYASHYAPQKYSKMNGAMKTSPKYKYSEAIDLLQRYRGLTEEAAKIALERNIVTTNDGLYRFTWDQRWKMIVTPPMPMKDFIEHFNFTKCPVLVIQASETKGGGEGDRVGIIFDEMKKMNRDCFIVEVEGNHDVHLNYPDRVAKVVEDFLLKRFHVNEAMSKL